MQPKEPEVQVFVTANNSNLRELCGITLGSDLSGNAANASREPSDASRETPQGLARARQAPGEEKPGDEENLREGNIKGADPWRETLQQSHNSIVELKELPAHLKYAFLEEEKIHPVIISSALDDEQEHSLLSVLRL